MRFSGPMCVCVFVSMRLLFSMLNILVALSEQINKKIKLNCGIFPHLINIINLTHITINYLRFLYSFSNLQILFKFDFYFILIMSLINKQHSIKWENIYIIRKLERFLNNTNC